MGMLTMDSKPVLFISPLPPPMGGIAVWTKKIIDGGFPDGTPVTLVNTRIIARRNIFQAARLSGAELFRTLSILSALLFQLIFKRPRLVHLSCSVSSAGIFRDALCALLAKVFLIPVVAHYHGNLQDFSGRRFFGCSQKAMLALLRLANCNLVGNTPSQLHAEKHLKNRRPVLLLPNFIEDRIFARSRPPAINIRPRAIFCGGITRAKGCAEILAVALQFPAVDFHLIGKMHNDMQTLYATPPQNIILHGELSHAVLLEEMARSDFLIFPSYTEGFPLTVLEAMALGLPVIGTTVGAIPEMIAEKQGGFLVPPRDTFALAAAINKLLANSAQLSVMGEYNKDKSFTHYRYSAVITRLLEIYAQLPGISKKGTPRKCVE
jgi:glycosyltransferase involved in cell wall biosynthesis